MAYILIIDDEKAMRLMMSTILESAGHEVAEAADGRPGEAAVARRLPDLVITDIIMPEQEGIGLIMSLRQKYKALKILAISGGGRLSHVDCLQMAKQLGANATLAKPFRRDALLAAVQKLLTD